MIFSTHYMAEAELLCDRIGFLYRGRLLREASPAALRAAAGVQTLEELQDLYPQLVSFLAQNCSARKTYLQSIGITGQSLL